RARRARSAAWECRGSPANERDPRTTVRRRRGASRDAGPWREGALDEDEDGVGDDRERHRQDRAEDERRAEELLDPEQDEISEAALTDERRHRDETDRRDRRDPDPREDHA